MQLSKRETQLIEIFIKHGMTLTGQELAEFAKISTKTVYRTIKKINEASSEGDIILSEVGKGFSLDYEKYLKENSQGKSSHKITGPVERRNTILLTLLFKSPLSISIREVFSQYYVSETVINNDLNRIMEFLADYQLRLIKKKQRISIEGSEKNIRKVVNSLISANTLWEEEIATERTTISSYDINFITSLLEFIERELGNGLTYPYNINLFSHLYILIKRVREGELRNETMESFDEQERKLIAQYKKLYELSKKVVLKLNNYLNLKLSDSEIFYLFQYLISSRIENQHVALKRESKEAQEITEFFAKEMSHLMGLKVDHATNQNDLFQHIEPMLYRLQNEIIIKNDLLNDIKLEYAEIFQQVKSVSQKAQQSFQCNLISDDEIGFLTLYFVKYKELADAQRRVLIMCSSGVGTSELLKVKVRKAFPELEIVDVLSARKFTRNKTDYQNIDLILTTVHLASEIEIPSILVNSVFTKQDEQRVKQMLGEI